MIIVRLSDGLGNQMFQYALGRRLADKGDTKLRFDTTWFDDYREGRGTKRTLTLDEFDLTFERASDQEIRDVIGLGCASIPIGRIVGRFAPQIAGPLLNYYREILDQPSEPNSTWPHRRHFSERILSLNDDAYLHGYWQSPDYFDPIRDALEGAFSVSGLQGRNAEAKGRIEDSQSVGVHVRRGDFIEYGNALSPAYYEDAVEIIEGRVEDPEYFVFSNDIEWARGKLPIGDATYVDWNDGSTDYVDLYLLSRCRHTVTANSTFSWWGAWLRNDGHVITPTRWWHDAGTVDELWDFIPESWVRVESRFD